jgi:orotate phosphoribosyltransferase
MNIVKHTFIEYCIKNNILTFNEYKNKINRVVPYRFNSNLFCSSEHSKVLSYMYIKSFENHDLSPDNLIGIPLHGVSLISSIASLYGELYNKNISFSFFKSVRNKTIINPDDELIGYKPHNNSLLLDVNFSSTSKISETVDLIRNYDCNLLGLFICLDREEIVSFNNPVSFVNELIDTLNINIYSIITLSDIVDYLKDKDIEIYTSLLNYKNKYGLKSKIRS